MKERINKIISQNFSASFMNNSKWVKLISKLIDNHKLIERIELKLIYDDKIRELIITGDEQFDFDYYSTSMESMVTNPIVPGWTVYKEIEWIKIIQIGEQITLEKEFSSIGKFDIEINSEYLKIYAYR